MRMKAPAGFVGFVGVVLGVVVVGAGVLSQGCGGGGGKSCDVGSESCPCTSGGICNSGLACVSKTCVNLSGPDGGAAGTTGTGGNTGSTDPDVACADVSKYCEKYNECAPLLLKIIYGSVDACSTRLKLSCKDGFIAPKSGLTAANIAACSAALPAASCSDVVYRKVAACQYKGTTDNGGACGTGEQCKSSYCAQGTNACGVCADLLKAGNTCDEDSACEPGLICSADAHCVLPSAGGTACSTNQPCTYGYYCSPGGTCAVTKNDPGGACNDVGSCNGFLSLFCAAGSCKTIVFANAGSTCGSVGSDLIFCLGSDCSNPDETADTGVCAARAKDGEVCGDTTANGRSCQAPALCASGHCKVPSSAACL